MVVFIREVTVDESVVRKLATTGFLVSVTERYDLPFKAQDICLEHGDEFREGNDNVVRLYGGAQLRWSADTNVDAPQLRLVLPEKLM